MDDVWAAFSRGLREPTTPAPGEREVLACIEQAVAAWPDIDVPRLEVAHALAVLVGDIQQLPSPSVASELYLALACAKGNSAAIAHFEARYFKEVDAALLRVLEDRSAVDDIKQRLRTRLFVAPQGRRARILDAVGHGELSALVRIAATRLALNDIRGDKRREGRSKAFDLDTALMQPAADSPELEVVRRTHQARFKEAFEAAIATLSARDRTLLRYHLVEHLTIDDLARMHGVHRSSAARWLAQARAQVAQRTQERLADVIGDESALPALFALVRSRLDLSITRLLAADS